MIYFVQNGHADEVKIGYSKDPGARKKQLQTGSPLPLRIIGITGGDSNKEHDLHLRFSHSRLGGKTEWFRLSGEVEAYILSNCEQGDQPEGLTAKFVLVTPDQAQRWLTLYGYELQRKLREKHVSVLSDEMKRGRFKPTSQVGFAILRGRPVLVNGQHTLHAVVRSGIAQMIQVSTHRVKSDSEIGELYYTYDIHKKRTFGEIAVVLRAGERTGFSRTQMTQVGSAVKFITADFMDGRSCPLALLDQVEAAIEYGDAGQLFFNAMLQCVPELRKKMQRKATMGVALATCRFSIEAYGVEMVRTFWQGIAEDDLLARNDPRKAAFIHILTTQMPSGRGRMEGNICSAGYSARYIANCWNAWVEGRELARTSVADHKAPITIFGTPFADSEGD